MSFKVLLLVCAVTVQHRDCQPDSALAVLNGPDTNSEITCALHGQAYLAGSALAASLTEDEYIKVMCRRTTIGKANVG